MNRPLRRTSPILMRTTLACLEEICRFFLWKIEGSLSGFHFPPLRGCGPTVCSGPMSAAALPLSRPSRRRRVALLLGAALLLLLAAKLLLRPAFGALYVATSDITATEDTLWAPGFSEAAFAQVREGDTREQVRARLGEPLRTWMGDGVEAWSYTTTLLKDDYWVRQVRFDVRTGRVVKVVAELYVD